MSIEVKNLLKQYGEQKAVNDISFTINKGEIVGFLGPNGAGKSTTMKMITGYLQPDAGEIIITGIDVRKHPLEAKKKIGYLPESNALYYDMYIREYLAFIGDVHKISNPRSAINQVIEQVRLTPESKKKIGQLSKGYKQRVGLAAALLHDPEVLILDEPASGLDPNQIVEIRQVIKEQGKNKLVLFSSHILQEVEAICDRIIIINKGKLVADDKLINLQNINKNIQTVIVQFAETVDKTLLEQLKDAEKVEGMLNAGFQIQTSSPDAVRKGLVSLALEHNLNIVSLQTQNQSLEKIFQSLTTN
jgi:ABC-2 type transport system ATP-binding protein